jgi:hypothetical protein
MEVGVYVCFHIFENSRPILLVSRAGGDWQCLCGGQHRSTEVPHLVGFNHLIERDPTLEQLKDLPKDWEAERAAIDKEWIRTPPKAAN